MTKNEKKSFDQALKILCRRDICIICPESLSVDGYKRASANVISTIRFKRFEDRFFTSTAGYNELMLNPGFYQSFVSYSYIFIYQLDAWIFYDNLDYWLEKGYDYIGAPIFENFDGNTNYKFLKALNGGFSIRNTAKALFVLDLLSKARLRYRFLLKVFRRRWQEMAKNITRISLSRNSSVIRNSTHLSDILKNNLPNEDYVWSEMFAEVFEILKICPTKEAMGFAFECHPSYLYQKNEKQLPMGVHAWEKYEPEFWNRFILSESPYT